MRDMRENMYCAKMSTFTVYYDVGNPFEMDYISIGRKIDEECVWAYPRVYLNVTCPDKTSLLS